MCGTWYAPPTILLYLVCLPLLLDKIYVVLLHTTRSYVYKELVFHLVQDAHCST